MTFLERLLIGGVLAVAGTIVIKGGREARAAAKEEQRRRESPVQFIPWLTPQDFALMTRYVASKTPRVINTDIEGLLVEITVQSNSGLTVWTAELDFNDYGNPSGRYWIRSDNEQSSIPKWFADMLRTEMVQRLDQGRVRFS